MAYYVYLLRCEDESLYGGITTDPKRRCEEHKAGVGAKYTRAHGAKYMERIWLTEDRGSASRLEYAVKRLPKEKKESLASGAPLSDVGIHEGIDCGNGDYAEKLSSALVYCKKDPLRTADISEPINLGIAKVAASCKKGILVYLPYSRFYQICADDRETTEKLLPSMTEPWDMVVTHHPYEEDVLSDRFSLSPMERVVNAVYRKKTPPVLPETNAVIRPLTENSLREVLSVYTLYDAEEEMRFSLSRGELLGAFVNEKLVGFISFHAEGSMGMLEVLPEFRRLGYGTALVGEQIKHCLAQKRLPFGQIFCTNEPSLAMQKKLGFCFSPAEIRWFCRIGEK